LIVTWSLACGTNFHGVKDTWQTVATLGTVGTSNFVVSTSNVFELFDVGLYEGTIAPAYVVPNYSDELELCQRYYFKSSTDSPALGYGVAGIGYGGVSGYIGCFYSYHVRMRATPSCSLFGTFTLSNCSAPVFWTGTPDNYALYAVVTAAGGATFSGGGLIANARL
jgi:hypothetical protein